MDLKPELRNVYEEIIDHLSKKLNLKVYAALAYGSLVAGYGDEHSDYDLIIISEELKYPIRYIYEKFKGRYASVLLVKKPFFEEDVKEARHGEFVAGRLYTIYIPLINEKYIHDMDLELKKRACLEEIEETINEYGELAYSINIPVRYFLLSRLKQRATIYPIVKYSYIKMFSGRCGEQNLQRALRSFYEALKSLESEGLVNFVEPLTVKIVKRTAVYSRPLYRKMKYIKRAFKLYFTHLRSARVSPRVVFYEIRSKLKRYFKKANHFIELESPSILLSSADGIILKSQKLKTADAIKELYPFATHVRKIKRVGLFSNVHVLEVSDGNRKELLVCKCYGKNNLIDIVKWIFVQLWLLDVKCFIISSRKRLINETLKSRELSLKYSIKTPRPLLILWRTRSVFFEYILGKNLVELAKDSCKLVEELILNTYREFGEKLGLLHKNGLTLGDTKPDNIIVHDNSWYCVDLEQATYDGKYAWDIAEILYFSFRWFSPLRKIGIEKIVRSFLEGYLKHGHKKDVLKALSFRYIRPFLPFTPLTSIIKVRRAARAYIINSILLNA
ncbi:MAG: hypothetical protein QXH96_00335 [Candidatus Geothermarchaeota archaeon]